MDKTISAALAATYNVTGKKIVTFTREHMFGSLTNPQAMTFTSEKTATGDDLMRSIMETRKHIARLQEALESMEAILAGPAVGD